MRTPPLPLLLGCTLLFTGRAHAQAGLNVDFGPAGIHGAPSASHGAAAGVGGEWNEVDTDAISAGSFPVTVSGLVDTAGAPSGVTVVIDDLGTGFESYLFDSPLTLGGDDALLDDLAYFGGSGSIEIHGLAAGQYDVYTYATVPDGSMHATRIRVPSSPDPAQNVGGAFAGGYAPGITHARHEVTVSMGGTVTVLLDVGTDFMSLNGIQVVPFGATGDLGARYCTPAIPNSTGIAGTITAFGSPRRSDNDVSLTASSLPLNTFGFFLNSRSQGFVAAPGGSAGNLCLGGAIGRYVGAGQVQNSGGTGAFSLSLDLSATPTPTGFVSILAGETWNFQAWHRDALAGIPVSNLTDGRSITFF